MEIDKKSQVRDSERKFSFVIRQAVSVSFVYRQRQCTFLRQNILFPRMFAGNRPGKPNNFYLIQL